MSLVRERSQKGEGASAAAAVAVREAARFDRGALSLRAGLVAAEAPSPFCERSRTRLMPGSYDLVAPGR